MCVGPMINGPSTPQPKPAAQQTSEGVAEASPAVWRTLASQGGMMGSVAKAKLAELVPTVPVISKSKK